MMAKPKQWMKQAFKNKGAFTRKAKAAGKSVQGYASSVLKPSSKATTKTKLQARLAKRAGPGGDIYRSSKKR